MSDLHTEEEFFLSDLRCWYVHVVRAMVVELPVVVSLQTCG